jgi:protein-L-isoaspartate(D-aspartate) O-methyltransferase
MINTNFVSSSAVFNWTKEYLLTVLISGKDPIIKDPLLINAFKSIDRKDFIPEKFQQQAYGDYELEIGYGEKINKPTTSGQMLSYLKPKFGGKYLDIGTGTGYIAALLGYCAGDSGKVYTIERVQWLWEAARVNLKKYPDIRNVESLYRDGLEGLINKAPFDGIHVSFSLDTPPENLKSQLKTNGGILIYPTTDNHLKVIERKGNDEYVEEIIAGFVLDKGKVGVA